MSIDNQQERLLAEAKSGLWLVLLKEKVLSVLE